ncbi:MAG: hypothetical protein JHC61_16600 [Burkholderiaceae bacterium]|nr:hypothetical protein [Burkholderiaceae bacterium]
MQPARGYTQGHWALHAWNPRDATHDAHRTVDGRLYGGDLGMVMKAEPLRVLVERIRASPSSTSVGQDVSDSKLSAKSLSDIPDGLAVILLWLTGRRFAIPI